ncbi:hypothetical protein [Pyrococcus kukulkanii]|uniref:hypothetical protein n=1 Tax=Pyrococcus kukulkanii TaxID=1609559 RepID=UPI00082B8A69|nr:hypothetical protein [Pyrococcus kukulkanii]
MIRKIFGILLIALALTISGSASTFRSYTAEREIIVKIGNDPLIDVECLKNGSVVITNNMNVPVDFRVFCFPCLIPREFTLMPGDEKMIDICLFYCIKAEWDGGGAKIKGCCIPHCHHHRRSCKG